MKKIKDYLTLALAAVAFVFITNSAKAQTIQTLNNETIWKEVMGPKKLTKFDEAYVFSYLDLRYSQLNVRESIVFLNEEEMNTFFLKLKEIMELPSPKGKNQLTMEIGNITIVRPKNTLGVANVYIFDGKKYFLWDINRNKQVLKKLNIS